MSKKKLLYISDSPTVETGFGRVTEGMLDVLKDHFDVYLFGINYYNVKHNFPYPIFPATGPNLEKLNSTPYGDDEELQRVFSKIKPDIVVANNDTWVLTNYSKALAPYIESGATKFFGYVPIDGAPYHRSLIEGAFSWTAVATYTQFGKTVLENAGLPHKVKVINHGTNMSDFFPMDKTEARRELGLRDDVFLVFNGNRNQSRKRYDIMVKGFSEFLKGKPKNKVGLFAHGGLRPSNGWNVPALLEREMQQNNIDTEQKVLYQYTDKPYPQNMVTKKKLNIIYNAMDVGINTCMGEGWGLVNTEHAVTGVPQIVPNHSSLGELFAKERGFLIPVSYWETERPYLIERGIVSPKHVAKTLNNVYSDYDFALERGQKAREFFTRKELTWNYVANEMLEWIQEYM